MRVTAGTARGRRLRTASRDDLRPTADKVKQALFSMLESEAMRRAVEPDLFDADEDDPRFACAVAWPRVLDLYAGTGALGIEALSRGARHAEFVERNPGVCRLIVENLERTGLRDRGHVTCAAVETALSTLNGPYDLIVLDPPYREAGASLHAFELVMTLGLLAESGVIAWEHDRAIEAPALLGELHLLRSRTHGTTTLSVYCPAELSTMEG